VLIHGRAEGVSYVAIQMAKAQGAYVATTVSTTEKAEIARRCGADEIIRYRDESVVDYVKRLTDGRGFDVVFYDADRDDDRLYPLVSGELVFGQGRHQARHVAKPRRA
jgi:NADPH2:quinone reductase